MNLFLAFITGLTTGGLSCLAVQGGLLATSLAQQIENSPALKAQPIRKKKGPVLAQPKARPQLALPIAAFLAAKLLAYTLLGFILGWAGSMFQLSIMTRALLQIAIGIFMVGSALRMLNVHPIFRYFAFEPPASLRRYIRRKSNSESSSLAGPLFLGLLTVLIPCGITQAMMAVALATASPMQGAAIMFTFTLGTSPVFFAVAYFATRLGERLEKNFSRAVAVLVLILGIFSVDTGLTLAGSPVSITRFASGFGQSEQVQSAGISAPVDNGSPLPAAGPSEQQPANPDANVEDVITITVVNGGYEPRELHAPAGKDLRLRIVSNKVYSCALSIYMPDLGVQASLRPTDEMWVDVPAQPASTVMDYSCSMGMYTGRIVFDG